MNYNKSIFFLSSVISIQIHQENVQNMQIINNESYADSCYDIAIQCLLEQTVYNYSEHLQY